MGWVMMSERELNRIEVLSQLSQCRVTATTAANVLGLSRRQVHRLLKKFQTDGPAAIRHKARGRASNNRIDPAVREFAVTLVRKNYIDFGPTFATDRLSRDPPKGSTLNHHHQAGQCAFARHRGKRGLLHDTRWPDRASGCRVYHS